MEDKQKELRCSHMWRFLHPAPTPFSKALGETRRKRVERCHKCGAIRHV